MGKYSEICLNQRLNKTESCINQTLFFFPCRKYFVSLICIKRTVHVNSEHMIVYASIKTQILTKNSHKKSEINWRNIGNCEFIFMYFHISEKKKKIEI